MGACYSVRLKVNVLDVPGAVKALNDHIVKDTSTNYSLEKYAAQGVTTETFNDLMRIFLAGWKERDLYIYEENGFAIYESDFNASYGWEVVMMEMFQTLTPFVKDGSEFLIYIDNDYDKLVVRNGKYVQVH